MSIEFEVDGPYKAMVLPASQEEGKLIKKRYAVFNFDGSLAEVKGFELKRRGELQLVKSFQEELFSANSPFLQGSNLPDMYAHVAAVANRWLDLLDTRGVDVSDAELLSYISESSTMSKSMAEYEGRKSCAITTALRLGSFLGDARVRDKGLKAEYIVSKYPEGLSTTERCIPVVILSSAPAVARTHIQKWCKLALPGLGMPDPRDIIDWDYYRERLQRRAEDHHDPGGDAGRHQPGPAGAAPGLAH